MMRCASSLLLTYFYACVSVVAVDASVDVESGGDGHECQRSVILPAIFVYF